MERPKGWEERITRHLLMKIKAAYPEEYERFWKRAEELDARIDIDPNFVGFIDVYFFLSQIIPRDRVVFDVGCAYAFQSYYFRDHFRYVGVDGSDPRDRLTLPQTCHSYDYIKSADDLRALKKLFVPEDRECFAVCSYVPGGRLAKMTKAAFPDCFTFYPSLSPDEKRALGITVKTVGGRRT